MVLYAIKPNPITPNQKSLLIVNAISLNGHSMPGSSLHDLGNLAGTSTFNGILDF